MLAIRLKRVGRANLAQYRVIVQDSHRHPKRGAVVEYLGTYDPHAKTTELNKDRIKHFLSNGAQPSATVSRLLKADGVKLPKWVTIDKNPKRKIRNPEKLRMNQPKDAKPKAADNAAAPAPEPAVMGTNGEAAADAPAEAKADDSSGSATKDDKTKPKVEKASDEKDEPAKKDQPADDAKEKA